MFTGLVEQTGSLIETRALAGDRRLIVSAPMFSSQVLGESILVNGVCLTITKPDDVGKNTSAAFDVSLETLACTTLGELAPGDEVNLERALMPDSRLGGHLVSGHVDGVGEVVEMTEAARSTVVRFAAPEDLRGYIARKGSICVEGVSLTVNDLHADGFDVNLVPHTLGVTTLGSFTPGKRVNLEVDMIARYVEQLVLHNDAVARRLRGGGAC